MTGYIVIEDDNVMTHILQVFVIGVEDCMWMRLLVIQMNGCLVIQHDTRKLHFESLGNHCKLSRFALVMLGRIVFSLGPFLCTHIFNISTSDFNAKMTAMEYVLKVLSYHGQIDAQISTNSCQIRQKDHQEHMEKLQVPWYSQFPEKKWSLAWDEIISAATPLHYLAMMLSSNYQTCKKWIMTLSSSMAMYSLMRDICKKGINGKKMSCSLLYA